MDNDYILTKITEHDAKLAEGARRLDDLERSSEQITEIVLAVKEISMSIKSLTKEIAELKAETVSINTRLDDVEKYPYKDKAARHDRYVSLAGTTIIGALIGYLLKTFLGV
jgi:chromosome segregation ATPase